ncbi:PTS glucose transporter subunit IIA [Azotosporobacter soli]|uniref:PTS sugar transporter subunit IIA n=1 Tax=Azotosporobacter soli TaxID=3055040 RepID=UPI0031FF238F
MFGLFSKKSQLLAPLDGSVIAIDQVPDAVFAQKTVGDGAAIADVTGDLVCAPADGSLEMVFHTNHAFVVKTTDELEVLVHIGINTVELKGQGFERLVEPGTAVKAGQPIIRIDRSVILGAGLSLVTPVVITNGALLSSLEAAVGKTVKAGQDMLLSYKQK